MILTETLVIIPAYNEEKTIYSIVDSIKKEYPAFSIIVIDDGSEDDTARLAFEAGAIVLSHPFNMGYGAAIQTGYKYALRNNYKYLVQIDGDGQHDIKDIRVLFENLRDGDCEIILGSRFLGCNDYKSPFCRHIGIIFFRYLLCLFSRKKLTDPTTGFQAMNRKVLSIFAQDLFPYDYPDADVIMLLSKLNIKIKEVPVRMYPNQSGKSMHNNPFKVTYYVFKMIFSMGLTLLRDYRSVEMEH